MWDDSLLSGQVNLKHTWVFLKVFMVRCVSYFDSYLCTPVSSCNVIRMSRCITNLGYSQSSNMRKSERRGRILPMVHVAQHLAFGREQQEMSWKEYQNKKCRYLLSVILQFPLIWASRTPKPGAVPSWFNSILPYTPDITESWHLTVLTAIFNEIARTQHHKGFSAFPKEYFTEHL